MTLMDDCLTDLIITEGFVLVVYDDKTGRPITKGSVVEGHPTIGYGRCLDLNGISKSEAEFLATNTLTACRNWAENNLIFWPQLNQVRKRVIINMLENLGFRGFLEFKNMIAALHNQQYDSAADEIMSSKAAETLPARYKWLSHLMAAGVDIPFGARDRETYV